MCKSEDPSKLQASLEQTWMNYFSLLTCCFILKELKIVKWMRGAGCAGRRGVKNWLFYLFTSYKPQTFVGFLFCLFVSWRS